MLPTVTAVCWFVGSTQLQNTLWPEVHKLYGHAYEIFCLAGSPDGKLIASACMVSAWHDRVPEEWEKEWPCLYSIIAIFFIPFLQSSKAEFAAIWIWDTVQWRSMQTLTHHTLTVTQLAFSHSSELLLAVSRDRTWSLWRQRNGKRLLSFVHCFLMQSSHFP